MTLTISVAVIAAIMVIVGLVAIVALIYIIRMVKSATSLIDTAKMHIAPISRDITVISQKTSTIIDSVHRQVESVEHSINTVKDMTTRVRQFEVALLEKMTSPLVGTFNYLTAFRKGFQVFFNVLRK